MRNLALAILAVGVGCGPIPSTVDGGGSGGGTSAAGGVTAGGLASTSGGAAGGATSGGAAGGATSGGAAGGATSGGVAGGATSGGTAGGAAGGTAVPMPAWRQAARKWEWLEIRGTSLSNLPVASPITGMMVTPSNRLEGFSGLAVDRVRSRLFLAGAGGARDWAGNEAYVVELEADQPRWRMLRGPTMGPQLTTGAAYNADGRPASSRLYWSLHYVQARNRVFRLAAAWVWGGMEGGFSTVDAFDLTTNDWDAQGTYPSAMPHGETVDRPAAQDPRTDDVYTNFRGSFRKWSAATATWSVVAPNPAGATDSIVTGSPSAFDTTRNQVLFTKYWGRISPSKGILLRLGPTPSVDEVTFTGTGTIPIRDLCGMSYVPTEDAYFVRAEVASTLYRINPTTFEVSEQPTTGIQPPTPINGIYSRWNYLPALKGIAYVPSATGNIWFLPTEP